MTNSSSSFGGPDVSSDESERASLICGAFWNPFACSAGSVRRGGGGESSPPLRRPAPRPLDGMRRRPSRRWDQLPLKSGCRSGGPSCLRSRPYVSRRGGTIDWLPRGGRYPTLASRRGSTSPKISRNCRLSSPAVSLVRPLLAPDRVGFAPFRIGAPVDESRIAASVVNGGIVQAGMMFPVSEKSSPRRDLAGPHPVSCTSFTVAIRCVSFSLHLFFLFPFLSPPLSWKRPANFYHPSARNVPRMNEIASKYCQISIRTLFAFLLPGDRSVLLLFLNPDCAN